MNPEMRDLEDLNENINKKETDILSFINLDDENFVNELLDDNSVDESFLRELLEDFDIGEELSGLNQGQEAEEDTHNNLEEPHCPPEIFDNSKNAKKFSCTFCTKSFPDKRYLNRHLNKHTGKFTCKTCKKAFARKESLIKHVNRCKGLNTLNFEITRKKIFKTNPNNFCTICDKQFTRKANFKEHMEKHDGIRIVCESCNKIYTSYRSFLRHRIIHEHCRTIHVCPNCIKPFFLKSSFLRHISCCNKNNVDVVCKKCNYKFKNDATRKKHENGEPKECVVCSKIFCLETDFRNHRRFHHPNLRFKCEICAPDILFMAPAERDLIQHVQKSHNKSLTFMECYRDGWVTNNSIHVFSET